ncbi:hypothetical protein D3C72_999600 [compost metagenome]
MAGRWPSRAAPRRERPCRPVRPLPGRACCAAPEASRRAAHARRPRSARSRGQWSSQRVSPCRRGRGPPGRCRRRSGCRSSGSSRRSNRARSCGGSGARRRSRPSGPAWRSRGPALPASKPRPSRRAGPSSGSARGCRACARAARSRRSPSRAAQSGRGARPCGSLRATRRASRGPARHPWPSRESPSGDR